MRFRASSDTIPGRVNQTYSRTPEDVAEPFRTAEIRKTRWLVATSAAGLLGVATLSTVLFLTPEPRDHRLATKPMPQAGMRTVAAGKISSDQHKSTTRIAGNSSISADHERSKAPKLTSGAGKQAMLKPATGRIEIKKTTARLETGPVVGKKATDHLPGPSITGIEKLTSGGGTQNGLATPEASKPQSHGDLIAAVKDGPRKPSSTDHVKSNRRESDLAKASSSPLRSADDLEDVRVVVGKGDTLYGLLTDKGISPQDATNIISELRPAFPPRNLKKGHILVMKLRRDPATGTNRPEHLQLKTSSSRNIAVKLNNKGNYERIENPAGLTDTSRSLSSAARRKTPRYNRSRARIQTSFYNSALAQNLPPRIVNKMTRVLSYDVDFQREINRGDTFEVLYSDHQTKDKGVLYTELVTNRKKHAFYRFKSPDGMINYYNKNGESAQKTFMRTPINGARITSRFGRRRHPILGYTKMHTGIDFGVARGTPIYAAASGKVQKAGWAGGYGKYVRIRHTRKLATAYAHMSRIAKGIRPGKKISQGQIIGFVGSTGRSTGPHLHYEIRVKGKPVNPMRYKLANKTKKLSRKWLALFKKEKSRIDRLRKSIPISTNVASISN